MPLLAENINPSKQEVVTIPKMLHLCPSHLTRSQPHPRRGQNADLTPGHYAGCKTVSSGGSFLPRSRGGVLWESILRNEGEKALGKAKLHRKEVSSQGKNPRLSELTET